MPQYLITTPSGQIVALVAADSPEDATKTNPYCSATLWQEYDPPSCLKVCPNCGSANTGWEAIPLVQRYCYSCHRKWALRKRRDSPDLTTLPPGLSRRQQAQWLYQKGYTAYQIFPALRVSKQACYKYIDGMTDIKISNANK